jgi:hypothetical protein
VTREVAAARDVTLLELVDRVVDRGVVLTGDLTISVADVDLIRVAVDVVLASVERFEAFEERGADEESL